MTKALRQALESALRDNPDDLAAHMAYGDLLAEQGDPRGEFIQTQIALEDPTRPAEQRKELERREKELLARHREEWLGPIHVLLDRTGYRSGGGEPFGLRTLYYDSCRYRFSRGWLESLDLDWINTGVLDALRQCPTVGLPFLGTLRKLRVGSGGGSCHITGTGIAPAIAKMSRLEELYLYAHRVEVNEVFALPMPNLRSLAAYHLHEYPLEVLGDNPTLGNLITLDCWPHALEPDDTRAYITAESFGRMVRSPHLRSLTHLHLYLTDIGDEGVRALVESGMLRQLQTLDLWSGCITDVGARALAASPHIKGLKKLRLSQNFLTDEGIAVLRATGVNLEAESMFDPDMIDDEEREYLFEGDCE